MRDAFIDVFVSAVGQHDSNAKIAESLSRDDLASWVPPDTTSKDDLREKPALHEAKVWSDFLKPAISR
ncbi:MULTISPECIES: hypothetical protein [unclassified Mesorhizobium]|uniref:hypothetical protein n=1 Tax=unclassified Mesorhizobium TaxID=325217 RepID=UPI001CC99DF2|nr:MULTISPECIES: hypothetical protein [unclassified Mesorhizobium]MBZ9683549.1 hypothetical protein [Mesorhizobium sp. CO1-1-2]MBZ9928082.1 hypothetical protein [Mesorhizobium sp. BR1-1-4]